MNRFVVTLALLTLTAGCGGNKEQAPQAGGGGGKPKGPMAFPVETVIVSEHPVQYIVSAVGSVDAFEEVKVTARVAGVVEKVSFIEGDKVTAGKVLAAIEPARYKVAADSARAAYRRVVASGDEAEAAFQRREELVRENPNIVRQEELEGFRSRAAAAAAEKAQAKAALDLAELNLRDAYVRSPAPGVIQTRSVDTGQYVQPGTVIATLVREQPLLLRFNVAAAEAERLNRGTAVRFLSGGNEYGASILNVGAAANPQSRMVAVVAKVDPGQRQPRPGAFAEVRAIVGGNENAIVIPQIAVRPTEEGLLAFVIEDGKAKRRIVESGMRTPDGGLEILKGLRSGEELVVRGADALRDGASVRILGDRGERKTIKPSAGDSTAAAGSVR